MTGGRPYSFLLSARPPLVFPELILANVFESAHDLRASGGDDLGVQQTAVRQPNIAQQSSVFVTVVCYGIAFQSDAPPLGQTNGACRRLRMKRLGLPIMARLWSVDADQTNRRDSAAKSDSQRVAVNDPFDDAPLVGERRRGNDQE